MGLRDIEIEPNSPDWTKEIGSDQRLVDALQQRLESRRLKAHDDEDDEKPRELLERLKALGFVPKR